MFCGVETFTCSIMRRRVFMAVEWEAIVK